MTGGEVGAIICAALVMLFLLFCAMVALLLVVAKKKPITSAPMLVIDPNRPEQALTQDGRLVATPKDQR